MFQTVKLRFLWSLEIYRFMKIVNFDTAWIIPISFMFLYISLKNTWFQIHFQSTWIQLLLRCGKKMSSPNVFLFFKNKGTWWYKQLFFKLCFRAKYNLKPKMYIVVIWLSSYSLFFFLLTFQCFSSVYFLLILNVSCAPPSKQENRDS